MAVYEDFNKEVAAAKHLRQLFVNIAIENVNREYEEKGIQLSLEQQDELDEYFKKCIASKELWMQNWKNIMKHDFSPRCCKWLGVA